MKIEITDHRKIYTIQKEFSAMFPFLKIEFFAKPSTADGVSPDKLIHKPSKTLGTCRTIHRKGFITVTPNMSVRDLRETFDDVYGLRVRISRISGDHWMDASASDGWSLEKQNKEGMQSSIVQQTV